MLKGDDGSKKKKTYSCVIKCLQYQNIISLDLFYIVKLRDHSNSMSIDNRTYNTNSTIVSSVRNQSPFAQSSKFEFTVRIIYAKRALIPNFR